MYKLLWKIKSHLSIGTLDLASLGLQVSLCANVCRRLYNKNTAWYKMTHYIMYVTLSASVLYSKLDFRLRSRGLLYVLGRRTGSQRRWRKRCIESEIRRVCRRRWRAPCGSRYYRRRATIELCPSGTFPVCFHMPHLSTVSTSPRRIGLQRPIQSHRRPTLLHNLRVLPMQPPLLVLFHPGNFLFQPLLRPFIFICVSCGG